MQQVIPPSLLFDYTLTVRRCDAIPGGKRSRLRLPESTRLPVPAQLNSSANHLELRVAWNPDGLGISVGVWGRTTPPAGSGRNLKRCDHALLFIDTRHTATVHRAGSYCSGFVAIPCDDEADGKSSLAIREIAQQRDVKQVANLSKCRTDVELKPDGYLMSIWIPSSQLPGFDEVPHIGHFGFSCIVQDSEFGELPLNLGDDFPVTFDPSTWLRLELEQ